MTRQTFSLLLPLTLTIACASNQRARSYAYAAHDPATNTDVSIGVGPMPENESFSGSFHSQQIGDVYLDQTGDSVVGTYEYDRASCHATGRIEGTARGNVLRFRWTESQAECGRIAPLTGHGYFLFWKDSANNGRVNGEWGFNEAEYGGGPWALFRDRVRRQPQQRNTGRGQGVFDQDNSSGGSNTSGASGSGASGAGTSGATPSGAP
jgi:hypothetical protein